MAGLLEDSVAQGNSAVSGLQAATDDASRQFQENLHHKMWLRDQIAQWGGKLAKQALTPGTPHPEEVEDPEQQEAVRAHPILKGVLPEYQPTPSFAGMIVGSLGKLLSGGLLHNQAPEPDVGSDPAQDIYP